MLFRRLVLGALLVGVLAGLFLSALQRWQVVPLIAAAERFEAAAETYPVAPPAAPAHGEAGHEHAIHHGAAPSAEHPHAAVMGKAVAGDGHAAHDHGVAEWQPADGLERTAYTALANVLTAGGFALLLLAAMAGAQVWSGRVPVAARHGVLWGAAGYLSFYVAPAAGLPPEIPGAQSAALEARQLWWLLTVASTAGALALFAFGRSPWRWGVGLLLLALPPLLGAPHAGLPFAEHPPAVAAELTAMATQFFVATAIANGLYWLVLGSLAAWVFRRWLVALVAAPDAPGDVSATR